jgi:hypothetical protein
MDISNGILQPGIRYAQHWIDFDQADVYTQEITAIIGWKYTNNSSFIRLGLDVSYQDIQPAGDTAIQGLLQLTLVR